MINKKYVKNYIVFIASLLIFLILTLPFYTANVFATGIAVNSIYGSNGVQGYRKATDSTNVDVDAQIDGDSSIVPSQVTFGVGDVFSSCRNMGASFNCSYRSTSFTVDAKSYSYTIHLYNDTGTEVITAATTITIDNIAPTAAVDVLQNGTNANSNISITYSAADTACADSSCTGKCSGIKEIKLYKYDAANLIETIPINTKECSNGAAISRSASLFNYGNGSTQACVVAYDNIGQASSLICDGFIVDSSAPAISSLQILSNGKAVTYVGKNGITADVSVQITDSGTGLNANSVRAGFSQLNPSYASIVYAAATTGGGCALSSGINYCTWKSININATSGVSINFYADDNSGNNGSAALAYSFSADTSSPQVTYIGTNHSYGNISYASGLHKETVKATITESGSGLEKENVKLNFQDIGGATSVAATNCSSSSSTYTCAWDDIDFSAADDSAEKKLWVDSIKDNTGTSAEGITYGKVKIDKTAPVISNVYNISSSGICATSNDALAFYAAVSDNSGIAPSFTVNASPISSLGDVIGSCVNISSSTWNCSAIIQSLYSTAIETTVNVYAKDFAGNDASAAAHVTICQLTDTTSPPELVSSSVGALIPSVGIDRRIVSQTYATVFVPVTLTLQQNAEIISMDVDAGNCTSDYLGAAPYVMNEFSTEPYVVFKISGDLSDVDSPISIDCKLNLNMRNGNLIYAQPEVESFSVSIPLYNNALGTVDESVQDKVDSINSEISDLEKDISKWETWTKWLGIIYGIAGMLQRIDQLLQAIKSIVWGILAALWWALEWCGPCLVSLAKVWMAVCTPISVYHGFIQVIWPTGFSFVNPFAMTFKIIGMLYTCKLCDFGTWSNIGLQAALGAVRDKTTDLSYEDTEQYKAVSDLLEKGPYGDLKFDFDKPISVTSSAGGEASLNMPNNDAKVLQQDTSNAMAAVADISKITGRGVASSTTEKLKAWGEAGDSARIDYPIETDQWLFDPYKSIHYAQACLCMPGYVYNLKKDRQIKCMYRSCIEDAAAQGLPTTNCELAYSERECLYVESASYKLHGIAGEFFKNLLDLIWNNLPYMILGIAHFLACRGIEFKCNPVVPTDADSVLCGISGVALAILDWEDISDSPFNFNDYNPDLGGTDYCSS
ncbi:hypothetical protein HYU07_01120 [Candidatus Woesearchaeota archaeon]|nr:hypothetical protein [Candidatus Woesearchaeota archaeon]